MSKIVKIYDESSSDLFLKFQDPIEPTIMIELRDYLLRSVDSNDLVWKLEKYMQNTEYVQMLIEFLKSNTFSVKITSEVKSKLDNVKTPEELARIQKLGENIKNSLIHSELSIPGFKRSLKTYQIMPVRHLISLKNAANFSVPGSGKTTIILAAYALLKEQKVVDKLLVIGPYSSLMPWEDEIQECFTNPPFTIRIHGKIGKRMAIYYEQNNKDYEIYLTTYHTAVNDIDKLSKLISKEKFMVVLDESHNVKNINGKMANTLLNLNLLPVAKAILTGTPMPNDYTDLFIQFTFLYPSTLLGNATSFKAKSQQRSRIERFLKEQIDPLFTRITKAQLGLPEYQEHYLYVEMSESQTKLYRAVAEHYDVILKEMSIINFGLLNQYRRSKAIRLRQIASNLNLLMKPSQEYDGVETLREEIEQDGDYTGTDVILDIINLIPEQLIAENSPKIAKVLALVKKLREKGVKKLIIWSDFILNIKTMKKILENELSDLFSQIESIYGETPKAKDEDIRNDTIDDESREGIIRNFKKDPNEPAILIMNPMACAESISLHRVCHYAIYLDRSYNCGQFMQSKDRIHRIGLDPTDETHYYYLISVYGDGEVQKTIDHKINERLKEKENRMLEILNDPSRIFIDPDEFEDKIEDLIDLDFSDSKFNEEDFEKEFSE